jgi:hypothetical protein
MIVILPNLIAGVVVGRPHWFIEMMQTGQFLILETSLPHITSAMESRPIIKNGPVSKHTAEHLGSKVVSDYAFLTSSPAQDLRRFC